MAREINLVPDVKGEMIKALKLRNFIFFLCIVIIVLQTLIFNVNGTSQEYGHIPSSLNLRVTASCFGRSFLLSNDGSSLICLSVCRNEG